MDKPEIICGIPLGHLVVYYCKMGLRVRFTNIFSITNQMQWKFQFAFIQILINQPLQILPHDPAVLRSWHVQYSRDIIARNGFRVERIYHRIWIVTDMALVKWVAVAPCTNMV